jgi:hypothetical protein
MRYPAFFDQAPMTTLRDPLAAPLGASDDSLIDYHYIDAIGLAGHSCPTVASAWLMARAAMLALYPDGTPERGGATVQTAGAEDEGVNGVIGQVFMLITGAAAANGFHGIGGRFVRQSLLIFSAPIDASAVQVHRLDNGEGVSVELDMAKVPAPTNLRPLLGAALDSKATPEQRAAFGRAWQDRMKRLLLEHADDSDTLRVTQLH